MSYLKDLDYSVVQQCMHCGMCLPTCPTYMETKLERNSPRGRISLMRAIADGQLEAKKAFSPTKCIFVSAASHVRRPVQRESITPSFLKWPGPRRSARWERNRPRADYFAGCCSMLLFHEQWTAPPGGAAALDLSGERNAKLRPAFRRAEAASEIVTRTRSEDAYDQTSFFA